MEITKEELDFIDFAFSLINRARYPDFKKVDELHNRIFTNQHVNPTSCGSCMRQRICDLKRWKDDFVSKVDKEINNDKTDPAVQSGSIS